jgi:hypothetical protein
MERPFIRPATWDDVHWIEAFMRQEDVVECLANGRSPRDAMKSGYLFSSPCLTVEWSGVPVVMFGVVASRYIWLLGTPDIEKIQRPFLRQSRRVVAALNRRFPVLLNQVHRDNAVHIKWLRWCGFTFDPVSDSSTFLPFKRIDTQCVNQ